MSAPAVSLNVLYEIQVPSSSEEKFFNLLFDAAQERVANALVSTLFERCRPAHPPTAAPSDPATTVDLQRLTVDFGNNDPATVPRRDCGDGLECYTLAASLLAQSARAVAPAEHDLAEEHLRDAVRRALREHSPLDVHSVATLRFQSVVHPAQDGKDDGTRQHQPAHADDDSSQGRFTPRWIGVLGGGGLLAVVVVVVVVGRRRFKDQGLSLSDTTVNENNSNNMEMASYKPTQQQELDETENSESFSDEEEGDIIMAMTRPEEEV